MVDYQVEIRQNISTIYYFIIDIITKQDASIEFYTTLDMIGEYFMKELQGSQFRCFCDIILGIYGSDIPS